MKRLRGTLALFTGLVALGLAASAQQRLSYRAVDAPHFIPAAKADFLSAQDRVIGLVQGGAARAYPAAILAQHGVVNDMLPDGPIAITW